MAHLAVTCVVVSLAITAPDPARAGDCSGLTIQDLAWLTGDWRGSSGDGDLSQEVWSRPAGGELMGMWRWVSGGEVRLYEFFTIAVEDVPVMRLRHFSRELALWEAEREAPLTLRLVEHAEREATFEGLEQGKSVRLTYRRVADDELHAILKEHSGTHTFHYRLQR